MGVSPDPFLEIRELFARWQAEQAWQRERVAEYEATLDRDATIKLPPLT